MKFPFQILIFIIFLFQLQTNSLFTQVLQYSFDDATKLTIEGTSNVNSFECKCKDKFPRSNVKINLENPQIIRFSYGKLLMKTNKLDCNSLRMNKDLCDALKEDQYPYITIELLDAKLGNVNIDKTDDWANIKATISLTITNISKLMTLDVKVKKIEQNKFRFASSKEILLTDFGIKPPTALFGLIKVNNKIKINLDITAILE